MLKSHKSLRWLFGLPIDLGVDENATGLRYGENPHQPAWLLRNPLEDGLAQAKPLQGKALSCNSMLDADAAYQAVWTYRWSLEALCRHHHPNLNPCELQWPAASTKPLRWLGRIQSRPLIDHLLQPSCGQ